MATSYTEFCTSKVDSKLHLGKIIGFGFGAALFLYVAIDLLNENILSTFLCVLMALPFILAIYRSITRTRLSKHAEEVEIRLLSIMDNEISFERYSKLMGESDAVEELKTLLKKGYIQNVVVVYEKNTIDLLNVSSRMVNQQLQTVYCPECGAKNIVQPGRLNHCEFCGTELIVNMK